LAQALSAQYVSQRAPLQETLVPHESAPLQTSLFCAPKIFTRPQLCWPEHTTLQSAPSHCTVEPHDCRPVHFKSRSCTAPPVPPGHEFRPEQVTWH
jgi:hypothetical protein